MHDLSEADKNRKQTKQGPAASGRAIDCIARETCPVFEMRISGVYPTGCNGRHSSAGGKQTDRRIKQEVRLSRTDIKNGAGLSGPVSLIATGPQACFIGNY